MALLPTKHKLLDYKISLLAASVALILVGLDLMKTSELEFQIVIGLIVGLFGLAVSFWHYIGASKEMRDERMLRIGTYATTLAWFCTMMVIACAIIIANYINFQYSGMQAMGFALSIGIGSMLAWLAYYSTKDDLPDTV
jgi:hypothetical protein